MAKDKEKLFRGVDDKAITFQRAVFIVCNLKRLIKRPKKDEKHGQAGGSSSRKRSGEDDDSRPGNLAGSGRKSRFKDPVRRAFTLPTMLCNSFSVGQEANEQDLTGCQAKGIGLLQKRAIDLSGQETTAVNKCATMNPLQIQLQPQRAHLGLLEPKAVGEGREMNNKLGPHSKLNLNNNSNSLYCLVTPIRRPPSNQNQSSSLMASHSKRSAANSSHLSGNLFADSSMADLQTTTMASDNLQRCQRAETFSRQPQMRQWRNNETANQPPAEPGDLGQICCPIWARFVSQLDARQGQPRDQAAFGHLIGPPAPTSYLLAPASLSLSDRVQVHLPRDGHEGSSDGGDSGEEEEEYESSSGEDWSEGEERKQLVGSSEEFKRPQYRRSSNELMENGRRSNSNSQRMADRFLQTQPGTEQQLASAANQSRPRVSPSSVADQSASRQQIKQTRQQLQLDLDQMRMKRFSSAICLADQQQMQQDNRKSNKQELLISGSRKANRKSARRKAAKSGAGQNAPASRNQSYLAPLDPVQLDRQRRPSVSNQSSANVDQQALFSAVECKQLERARAILDEGKANVNSLNGDKLTCLDIAVLMRNVEMVRLLQQFGAKESSAYLPREGRANQLYALFVEAKRLVEDLSRSLRNIAPAASNTCPAVATTTTTTISDAQEQHQQDQLAACLPESAPNLAGLASGGLLSSALFEEKQRQLQYWRRRLDLFMQMRYEFERLQIPSAPELIVLQVLGESSLGVKIVHSLGANSAPFASSLSLLSSSSSAAVNPSKLDPLDNCRAAQAGTNCDVSPRCFLGPKCSHWQLLSNNYAGQQMVAANQSSSSSLPFNDNHLSSGPSNSPYLPLAAADQQQQQQNLARQAKQQQKLAAFNQILAQQLMLLSCQQRHLGFARFAPACTCGQPIRNQAPESQTSVGHEPQCPANCNSRANLVAAQTSSIESVCENVASARRLHEITGSSSSCPKEMAAADLHQVSSAGCQSIAYQLITGASKQRKLPINSCHLSSIACPPSGANQQAGGACCFLDAQNNDPHQLGLVMMAEDNKVIITKYKIEWSSNERMDPIENSMIVYNRNSYPLECQISHLINGQPYFVRVSSGNHKGFSEPRPATPVCLAPSSWRQVDGNKRRKYDQEVFRKFTKLILLNKHILADHHQVSSSVRLEQLGQSLVGGAFNFTCSSAGASSGGAGANQTNKSTLINMLLLDAATPSAEPKSAQLEGCAEGNQPEQQQQSSLSVRKNFKNFFQSSSFKFHKLNNQNKRGLYLTTVIYHSTSGANEPKSAQKRANRAALESVSSAAANLERQYGSLMSVSGANDVKIVVTNDDRLPIIEVINDLVSPAALMSDFYWLLKINGTKWIDIKRLRQQLQKSHSSSTLHLRIKLLGAIEQMQLALNMEDIGRLFYKPIQAHDGSLLICTCKQVSNTKQVSNLSIKWTQRHKIIPRHLRKISDSMLGGQSAASSSSSDLQRRKEQQPGAATITVLPASTLSSAADYWPAQAHPSGRPMGGHSAIGLVASSTAMALTNPGQLDSNASGSLASRASSKGQFTLCEHCQCSLAQRRSTMASGSSSSSLASSNDSQWSVNAGLSSTRCRCNSSRLPDGQPANQFAGPQAGANCSSALSAPASQRSSMSTRSGSMISGNSVVYSNTNTNATANNYNTCSRNYYGRQSQPQQTMSTQSNPKPASAYLLLASLGLYDLLLFNLNEIIEFDGNSTKALNRGLYLGFVQLQTTVESMRLIVPRSRPNMVPCARIRDNAHVSREEWQLLKCFGSGKRPSQAANLAQAPTGTPAGAKFARSSDPSIWAPFERSESSSSSSMTNCSSANNNNTDTKLAAATLGPQTSGAKTDRGAGGNQLELTGSGGFDRSRAKSVSPGLVLQTMGANVPNEAHQQANKRAEQQNQQAGKLSVSSDQIGVAPRAHQQVSSSSRTSTGIGRAQRRNRAHQGSSSTANSDGDLRARLETGVARPYASHASVSEHRQVVGVAAPANARDGNQVNNLLASQSSLSDNSLLSFCGHECSEGEQLGGGGGGDPSKRAGRPSSRQSRSSVGEQRAYFEVQPEASTEMRAKPPRADQAGQRLRANDRSGQVTTNQQQPRLRCRSPTVSSRSAIGFAQSSPEETFVRLVGAAARRLLSKLRSQLPQVYDERLDEMVSILQSLNDNENNRIYHVEIIELSSQVTFILLIPSAENVCPVTSQERSNILGESSDYLLLPLQIFETIHINTYEPDLLGKYSRLSAILETDLIVAQHEHRQAFSSNELKSSKSRVAHLQDMISIADEFWRQLRWIVDVVSFARDKSASVTQACIKLSTIWRHFELSPVGSFERLRDCQTRQSSLNNQPPIGAGQRGCKPQPGRFQQQQQQTVKTNAAQERSGLQVKRTESARVPQMDALELDKQLKQLAQNDEQPSASCILADELANIHSDEPRKQRNYGSRRHSGDLIARAASSASSQAQGRAVAAASDRQTAPAATGADHRRPASSPKSSAGDNYATTFSQQQQQHRPICTIISDGQVRVEEIRVDQEQAEESVLDLRLCDEAEDEEAIYAYHISLHDATRAATQRKSSQQSNRAIVDEPLGLESLVGGRAGEATYCQQSAEADNKGINSSAGYHEIQLGYNAHEPTPPIVGVTVLTPNAARGAAAAYYESQPQVDNQEQEQEEEEEQMEELEDEELKRRSRTLSSECFRLDFTCPGADEPTSGPLIGNWSALAANSAHSQRQSGAQLVRVDKLVGPTQRRHLNKTTNPFLNDSLDPNQD